MATKKTSTANTKKMVESAEPVVTKVEETTIAETPKQIYSTVEASVYKAPVRQRDMVVGHLAPGRLYEYKGKDVNSEGTFYLVSMGYVYADENVHIK